MEMQDFPDLVKPYSTERVLYYYHLAQSHEWERPEEQLVKGDDGRLKLYRPQSMATKLKRFFSDYAKNEGKDVFKTWDNWEGEQAAIEAKCGPFPRMCISHVPFEKVLHYAARDADCLIRLWPILQRMAKVTRRLPQELWRGAA